MYDLPSESAEDPGLPDVRVSASTDEFHDLQPQLLSATFRPLNYARGEFFTGTDLNLYYDAEHTQWYKRPDWFAAVGVPRLYQGTDLRLSYVVWQERVNPAVVVELLSPGTEQEDLGQTERQPGQPPTKWQVYEQILTVPTEFWQLPLQKYYDFARGECTLNRLFSCELLMSKRECLEFCVRGDGVKN
jgi:Uma2 family endonuclease